MGSCLDSEEAAEGRVFAIKYGVVGRLSKTTFIHISVHLYSSNVVTLSKPNLVNKQQILLNLCLLLTYYTYGYSYLVLGVLQPTLVTRRFESSFAPRYTQPTVNKSAFFKATKPLF